MDNNYMEVVHHVNKYFNEHLPQYTILEIRRKSYQPEDNYLYMISAVKKDGSFAVWTSWNESIQSLNCGHYGLPSMEVCAKLMADYQSGSTYTDESNPPLEVLQKLLIKNDDYFEESYHQLLYIMGFVDGITAQQEHNWNKLSGEEINTLLAEVVEV